MINSQIKQDLQKLYPGKAILENKNANGKVTEILCEIEPTTKHPEYSLAIAVIDSNTPHYHKITTETYEVTKGTLTLFIDGVEHILQKGDTITIKPKQMHYATGNEAWIKVYSKPGWSSDDHILITETNIGAGGLVKNIEGEFLIVLQEGNVWSLPKGRQKPNETLIETAFRKVYEETGLDKTNLILKKYLGKYYRIQFDSPNTLKEINIYLFETTLQKVSPQHDDVLKVEWVSTKELIKRLTFPKDKLFIQNLNLQ